MRNIKFKPTDYIFIEFASPLRFNLSGWQLEFLTFIKYDEDYQYTSNGHISCTVSKSFTISVFGFYMDICVADKKRIVLNEMIRVINKIINNRKTL